MEVVNIYYIYLDGLRVTETKNKRYLLQGLEEDTLYKLGVSRVVDGKESEIKEVYATTLPMDLEKLKADYNIGAHNQYYQTIRLGGNERENNDN